MFEQYTICLVFMDYEPGCCYVYLSVIKKLRIQLKGELINIRNSNYVSDLVVLLVLVSFFLVDVPFALEEADALPALFA